MQDLNKEFKPTSWSIDNKVSIYIATIFICLFGVITYVSLPKEQFPEVVFPQIYIATIYAGAPSDVENLITKQIEKQVKSISGIKKSDEQFHSELFERDHRVPDGCVDR